MAELDVLNKNALVRSYVWGTDLSGTQQGAGGVGGLLLVKHYQKTNTTDKSVRYLVHSDTNGNVMGLFSINSPYLNKMVGTFDYDPFGQPVVNTLPVGLEACPFRFSTKYEDKETGMLYYGYRFLKDGRWISRDPIGERGGLNLYGFVGNDAVNRIDVLGLVGRGISAAKPNCVVLLRHMHGPNAAKKWRANWLASADMLLNAAGYSPGLDEAGISNAPFYGRCSVLSCKYTRESHERYQIDGVADSGGGCIGFDPQQLRDQEATNGGNGRGLGAFLGYIKQSWAAAIRQAEALASKCESDCDCKCEQITARFESASDGNVAASGRPAKETLDTALRSPLGEQMNENIPWPDATRNYPHMTPTMGSPGVPSIPQSGTEVRFKVKR